MESLVEVKLIGELGRRFGRSYSFVASSPREVISALSNQIAGFKDYLCGAHEKGIGFRLVDGDAEGMSYEEAMMGCKQLIIAPVITGGGSFGKILLGIALVALAFIPGVGFAAATAATATSAATAAGFTAFGSILFSLGTSLVLTGIASLLTPPVEQPRETERKDSFLFDRATELTTQGQPVPLLYGKFLAASPLIISSAITTQQVPV
jgi:predicted phage tail protein